MCVRTALSCPASMGRDAGTPPHGFPGRRRSGRLMDGRTALSCPASTGRDAGTPQSSITLGSHRAMSGNIMTRDSPMSCRSTNGMIPT